MRGAGESFDITSDSNILTIKSPEDHLAGPYKVIYKDSNNRWVIVAIEWDSQPRLGIRWFYGRGGSPLSSSHATWFVIPEQLTNTLLNGLTIDHKLLAAVNEFLAGDMAGEDFSKV